MQHKPWGLPLVALVFATACSGGAIPSSTPPATPGDAGQPATAQPSPSELGPSPTTQPSADAASPAPTLSSTASPTVVPADLPLWQTAELRDVRSNETFSIASFAGRLVVVEPMATWCTSCRRQQMAARDALAGLGDANVVYISLAVDPNERDADLAAYADALEFPWRFAVATRDVARSLADAFGAGVLSPPSVPAITITPAGEVELTFGHRDAAQLEAELAARLP